MSLSRAYIERHGYSCMVPGCGSTLGSESHHIRPRAYGGDHIEENLIVLCWEHHRRSRVHRNWQEWYVTLLTWKFYYETGGPCEKKMYLVSTAPVSSQGIEDGKSSARLPVGPSSNETMIETASSPTFRKREESSSAWKDASATRVSPDFYKCRFCGTIYARRGGYGRNHCSRICERKSLSTYSESVDGLSSF